MTTKSRMTTKPNIGLTDDQRVGVCEILNGRLADEYVLYTKTRKYHWNVTGLEFSQLHAFFEVQYDILEEAIDEIAERVRQLGFMAIGTLDEFKTLSKIKEKPGHNPGAVEMIRDLLHDHETVITQLRQDIDTTADKYHDMGTSDFLTAQLETQEKMAWMLRAHLEGE